MLTYAEVITEYKHWTKDTTTANDTVGKRRIQQAIEMICAGEDYYWLEQETTFTTVLGQQGYQEPANTRKLLSVKITVGGQDYVVEEYASPQDFDILNLQGTDVDSDYATYYHRRAGRVLLYPVPATNGNVGTFLHLRKPVPMLMTTDYTTGTVAVTNGSTAVVGTTTVWTGLSATLNENSHIVIAGIKYKIASITDNTNIVLDKAYQGTTASGLSYKIGDIPIIPSECHDIVWVIPALEYYAVSNEDQSMRTTLTEMKGELEARLMKSTASRVGDNVVRRRTVESRSVNDFPQSIG